MLFVYSRATYLLSCYRRDELERAIPPETAAYIPLPLRRKLHAGAAPEPEMRERVAVIFASIRGVDLKRLQREAPRLPLSSSFSSEEAGAAARGVGGSGGRENEFREGEEEEGMEYNAEASILGGGDSFDLLLAKVNDAFLELTRITHAAGGEVRDLLFDDKVGNFKLLPLLLFLLLLLLLLLLLFLLLQYLNYYSPPSSSSSYIALLLPPP